MLDSAFGLNASSGTSFWKPVALKTDPLRRLFGNLCDRTSRGLALKLALTQIQVRGNVFVAKSLERSGETQAGRAGRPEDSAPLRDSVTGYTPHQSTYLAYRMTLEGRGED